MRQISEKSRGERVREVVEFFTHRERTNRKTVKLPKRENRGEKKEREKSQTKGNNKKRERGRARKRK